MMGRGEEVGESQPLPISLLLEYDISETAGAPKEVKKKWKPVGSEGRGDTDRRHRGLRWGVGGGVEMGKFQ